MKSFFQQKSKMCRDIEMNTHKNKRYQDTDKKIQEAMIKLLNKQNFKRIHVKDIVKESGIDRSTFYEHYQDINQLMIVIEEKLTDKIKSIFNYSLHYTKENFVIFFEYVKENKYFYTSFFNGNYDHPMAKITFEDYINIHSLTIGEDRINSVKTKYNNIFFGSGLFSITYSWIKTGMEETIDTMAEIAHEEYIKIIEMPNSRKIYRLF